MNSTNHIGRLTADPELRRTGDGTAVCSFTLAVRRPRVKDTSDFIDFVVWRQTAEYLCQYGHKGDIVAVINGVLQSRKWVDKNGNNRVAWEINSDSVELLSSKRESQAGGNTTQQQNSYQGGNSYVQRNFDPIDDPDVKLPF